MDFLKRFLAADWEGISGWKPEHLVEDLQRYVQGDYPIYPTDDVHCIRLHTFLFLRKPDPRPFLPLLGPHEEGLSEVTDPLLRRDVIASSIVTSFMRRTRADDPWLKELYDAIAYTGVYFSFDRAYGESHTETGVDVGEFFGDWRVPPCEESRAAFEKHLPELLAQWRARVTNKGTSSFCGIVLRHLRKEGAEALAGEWARMNQDERYDLLKRLADEEELGKKARQLLADALLDPAFEVREAAVEALAEHDAPLDGLDASAPDEEMEKASRRLREWAAKTRS